MFTISYEELSALAAQILDGTSAQTVLAAVLVGLTAAWRVLRWLSRGREARRLQAAAAAYAARELARELHPGHAVFPTRRTREWIQAGAEA
jgi:hypothetical protein